MFYYIDQFNYNITIVYFNAHTTKSESDTDFFVPYFNYGLINCRLENNYIIFSIMKNFTGPQYNILISIYNANLTTVIQNGDSYTLDNAIMNLYKNASCIKSYF